VCCAGACVAARAVTGAPATANAAATPRSAGAAAPGSRRVKRVCADLLGLPKGFLPAKVALTRKAAHTVHTERTTCGQPSESPDNTAA
jgi:hypothetical protein